MWVFLYCSLKLKRKLSWLHSDSNTIWRKIFYRVLVSTLITCTANSRNNNHPWSLHCAKLFHSFYEHVFKQTAVTGGAWHPSPFSLNSCLGAHQHPFHLNNKTAGLTHSWLNTQCNFLCLFSSHCTGSIKENQKFERLFCFFIQIIAVYSA